MANEPRSVAEQAAASPWVAQGDGLAAAVAEWEVQLEPERAELAREAEALARPGYVRPGRAARHLALNSIANVARLGATLPFDVLSRAPLTDPAGWTRQQVVGLVADQFASGGAPAAEIARLVRDAGDLFPSALTDELARRDLGAPRLAPRVVHDVARRAHGSVTEVGEHPLLATAVSQAHPVTLASGDVATVRVRRPGFARDLREDARFAALRIAAIERLVPSIGGMSPSTFVALTNRQLLEASDLRLEALATVELGLLAEAMQLDQVRVVRPLAHGAHSRALLLEPLSGTPLVLGERLPADPTAALTGIVRLTLEAAVTTGVFWADPSVHHLLVDDEGRLVVAGAATVGRLSADQRRAGSLFLRSLLSGDAAGQLEAMRLAGAIPPGADLDALASDLASAHALQVSTILSGGQQGLMDALNTAVRLLLAHRLAPPLEVVLLVRTIFALSHLGRQLLPGQDAMLMALMPLIARLPELLADDRD
jgi:predicted unusual protein kinase regulating ubiquinone biosynthesis (AarF/ABC1/UbiB family)